MWIVCQADDSLVLPSMADDSHVLSSIIFSEKEKHALRTSSASRDWSLKGWEKWVHFQESQHCLKYHPP